MLQDYAILIIPLAIAFATQVIKVFIESVKQGFSWRLFVTYGGMPSSHTALVVSLATMVGLHQGFDSAIFALSITLALVVIWDAMGFRKQLGWHSKGLNKLIWLLGDHDRNMFSPFEEMLGHRPSEVLVGGILSLILTLILNYLISLI